MLTIVNILAYFVNNSKRYTIKYRIQFLSMYKFMEIKNNIIVFYQEWGRGSARSLIPTYNVQGGKADIDKERENKKYNSF